MLRHAIVPDVITNGAAFRALGCELEQRGAAPAAVEHSLKDASLSSALIEQRRLAPRLPSTQKEACVSATSCTSLDARLFLLPAPRWAARVSMFGIVPQKKLFSRKHTVSMNCSGCQSLLRLARPGLVTRAAVTSHWRR